MKIGVFDSGTGGAFALRLLHDGLPGCRFMYLGDTAGSYRTLSRKTALLYIRRGLDFICGQDVDLVVLVSHSIAAAVKGPSPDDGGKAPALDVPCLDIGEAAAKKALEVSRKDAVGILASHLTISTKYYEQLMASSAEKKPRLLIRSCSHLLPLIEEGRENKPETRMLLKKVLHPIKTAQVDSFIPASGSLAAMERWIIKKMGKNIRVIDPGEALLDHVKSFLSTAGNIPSARGSYDPVFFLTDVTPLHLFNLKRFFGRPVNVKEVSLL